MAIELMTCPATTEFNHLLERYRALDPRGTVLEIGSPQSETLWHWINGASPGGTVISVGWRGTKSDEKSTAQKYQQEVFWPRWAAEARVNLVAFKANSLRPKTIARVKRVVPSVDFLFIDGRHDYATVKADYFNYSPLVRPDGLIALAGIQGIEGAARFWNELKGADAWEECCWPGGRGIGLVAVGPRKQLTIVTACSRPENLSTILPGIEKCRDVFDVRWFIVHDGSVPLDGFPPWVVQQSHPVPGSVAGKGQINFALEAIRSGWVWVLDDDNAVHPNFARSLQEMLTRHPEANAFVFPQSCGAAIRGVGPRMVREGRIDQAQFVLRREFIGDHRYPLRYTGDGAFVEALFAMEPRAFRFCATPAVFYNALRRSYPSRSQLSHPVSE